MTKNTEDQKFRRLALALWLESKGGMSNVVKDKQLSSSIRSQMSHMLRGYSFGEVAARNLEKKLDLPPGWFDTMEDKDKANKTLVGIFDTDNKDKVLGSFASGLVSSWETKNIPFFPVEKFTANHKSRLPFKDSNSLPSVNSEPCIITDFRVSTKWFRKHVPSVSHINNLYVITGISNSENPTFNAGDPMLIDAGIKSVEKDAVYFFKLNGMDFIKRVLRSAERELRIMHSDALYDSWLVTANMDFQVLGKVLKIWRSNTF